MKSIVIIGIALVFGIGIGISINVSAEENLIPLWIKTTAGYWVDGQVSDREFLSALQFLVNEKILIIPNETNNEEIIETTEQLIESELLELSQENGINSKVRYQIGEKYTLSDRNLTLQKINLTYEIINGDKWIQSPYSKLICYLSDGNYETIQMRLEEITILPYEKARTMLDTTIRVGNSEIEKCEILNETTYTLDDRVLADYSIDFYQPIINECRGIMTNNKKIDVEFKTDNRLYDSEGYVVGSVMPDESWFYYWYEISGGKSLDYEGFGQYSDYGETAECKVIILERWKS